MSNLFGSSPKVIPEFTGLQVNTSVQVMPVPIIFGSPRVNVNLIYYNGFNAQTVNVGGGKGILTGGKGGGQEVEYFATIITAIGEGPLGDVKIIYQDQNVWLPSNYPTNGAFYFNGVATQAPWDYVTSNWPADARPYKNVAYYAFPNAQLDASATVPQIGIVVAGFDQGTSPLNPSEITISTGQYDPNGNPISYIGTINLGFADADPAQCIYDFLTNTNYGAGFPVAFIDNNYLFTTPDGFDPAIGDAALSTYCQAVGFAWSLALNNAESANSILERWCKNLVVAPVWNGVLLRFIPYWDQFAGTNPGWDAGAGIAKKYFQPYTTSIVEIITDFILQSDSKDEDPITFARKDPMEVYNTVRLDFKDRTNFFNDNPAEAKDEALIELYGPRVDNIGTGDEYSLQIYANISVTTQLRRNINIRRTYHWKMSPLWAWLEPMFVVTIPDPTNYSNFITVRLTSIEDDEDENCVIEAEEFLPGAQSPTIIPMSPTTPPNQGATNIPPSPVYKPLMFSPTTDMLTAQGFSTPQWVLGTSGGNTTAYPDMLDPNWGGCYVWVSIDAVNYQKIGVLNKPSTIGELTANLSPVGGTLIVDLGESDGTLLTTNTQAASSGYSLCVIQDSSGFELLTYTTANLIAPFTYELTGLYRGLYGTTSRGFGVGSQFLYVGQNANYFETALPPNYIGQNFWVKLQSFNNFSSFVEDLADCVAYETVAEGPTPTPPAPPPMVAATYRRRMGAVTNVVENTRRFRK